MKKVKIFFLCLSLVLAIASRSYAESASMKIVFENPSEIEDKNGPVKAFLPSELGKEDVYDTGGLKLDYDPSTSRFFVHTDLNLRPGESKTYKIVVEDVWHISEEELNFISSQAEDRLVQLEGGDNFESAKILRDKIVNGVQEIRATQAAQEGDVQNRIESYRVNKERLRNIRTNVILMKDFKQEAEAESDSIKYPKEIRFVVNVKNPSEADTKTEEILRYLPEGITPDNIIDLQGFDIKFDPEKKAYFLTQKLELKPGETKKIVVRINDRWNIPNEKMDDYGAQANDLNEFLKTTEFKVTSEYLFKEISRFIAEIKGSQAKTVTIKDRIAAYLENTKKMEAIRQDILELERLTQIIKERQRKNNLEELIKKLAPNEKTIWRIIYGTIVFLAIIGMATYILWWGQTKQRQVKKYEDISQGKK